MAVYTIQAPRNAFGGADLEDAVVLREGFSWPAFIFGLIWLVWKGLWSSAFIWVLIYVGLAFLVQWHFSFAAAAGIAFLMHLLLGFEGRALERRKFARWHYRLVDVVMADGRETAERISFNRISQKDRELGAAPPPPPPPRPTPRGEDDVLGLFPQAEERR